MRITEVRATPIPARGSSWLLESVIANPMSIYPRYKARRSSWFHPWGDALVQVRTDEGITGYSMSTGGPAAALIISEHLSRFLLGEDPFNVEMLWDQMFRATLPYGRKGLPIMAISAVDQALWDIIGKAKGEPVYRLLGGKTKDRIPVYLTGNDVDLYVERGYRRVKLAMPYGPADGPEGMRLNEELVASTRDKVGPEGVIMLDCYMAWDVEYTIRMADRLAPYRVKWIEECLPPDDIDGYAELNRKITSTAIATGEHEYTRYGFHELISRRAAAILQPDVNWVGGITEGRRIVAMASAAGLPVIPHAGGLQSAALHLMMASVNCPMAECVIVHRPGDQPARPLLRGLPEPVDGYIVPSDKPGLGLELDEELLAELTAAA